MKFIFSPLVIYLITHCAFAASIDPVTIYNASTMVVTGHTNIDFTLGSETPSGDASSETSAAKVYIPIKMNYADQVKYFSLYKSGVTSLFEIENTGTVATYSRVIKFPLVVTSGTGSTYLYAAAKMTDNQYHIIAKYSEVVFPTGTTSQSVNFSVSPQAICDQSFQSGATTCTNLINTSANDIDPVKFYVYFFQSTTNFTVNNFDAVDPAADAYKGGSYFNVHMSNRVYTSSDLGVNLSSIKVGDGRLKLNFTTTIGTMKSDLFDNAMAFKSTGGSISAGDLIGDSNGEIIDLNFASQSGEMDVTPLINGTPYTLAVFLVDKYKFASTLSVSMTATPLKIEELLKKQACYLLTAGFGEEHFIIDYFRNFRDQVLSESYLGRKFIAFYYDTAPKYALIIYKHESLRSVIRGVAYLLYFLFRHEYLVSITLLLIIVTILFKKRERLWQFRKKI